MKEKILLTKKNYKDIIYNLKYGYETIIYESEEVHTLVLKMIEVINEFTNNNTLREDIEVIDDVVNGEWVSTKVPNVYRIICSSHDSAIPILHENNYIIEEIAIKCKKESIILPIDNFDLSLIKYAKKIALKHNIKFTGFGFNGKTNSLSIKKQIEDAFLSGKSNIYFPCESYSSQTIRNYASSYGNLVGRKFKVELSKGVIIVRLKDENEIKALFVLAKDIFDKIGLKSGDKERDLFFKNLLLNTGKDSKIDFTTNVIVSQEIPKNNPAYIVNGVSVSAEEWMQQPIWIRQGYASEDEMNEDF